MTVLWAYLHPRFQGQEPPAFPGRFIPRTFLRLLQEQTIADCEFVSIIKPSNQYSVFWLDGNLLRGLTYAGVGGSGSASAFAYPLSMFTGAETSYTLTGYDESDDVFTDWYQTVSLHFSDREPIAMDIPREDSRESSFVAAVLRAVRCA
jgi:hypothetical protein